MASTVIGFYEANNVVQDVVRDLSGNGFSHRSIEVISGNDSLEGLTEKLTSAGAPRSEAELYAEGVRRGGSLVTVTTDEEQATVAAEIMQAHDPVYIEARADQSREGVTDASLRDSGDVPRNVVSGKQDETHIPVAEEQLQVGKRTVERGGVRVHSYVTEVPVEEQVRLRDETVRVDRRPVDRAVSNPDDLFREQTLEVTEINEEAVVAKEARVVEEVVVSKAVDERVETVRDTLRRTDVEVEQLDNRTYAEQEKGASSDNLFDTDFRRHFSESVYATQHDYDQFQPAYHYGYGLASNQTYSGRNWNDIEGDVRRDWERDNQRGPWDQFKESVRYAWERARNRI